MLGYADKLANLSSHGNVSLCDAVFSLHPSHGYCHTYVQHWGFHAQQIFDNFGGVCPMLAMMPVKEIADHCSRTSS